MGESFLDPLLMFPLLMIRVNPRFTLELKDGILFTFGSGLNPERNDVVDSRVERVGLLSLVLMNKFFLFRLSNLAIASRSRDATRVSARIGEFTANPCIPSPSPPDSEFVATVVPLLRSERFRNKALDALLSNGTLFGILISEELNERESDASSEDSVFGGSAGLLRALLLLVPLLLVLLPPPPPPVKKFVITFKLELELLRFRKLFDVLVLVLTPVPVPVPVPFRLVELSSVCAL